MLKCKQNAMSVKQSELSITEILLVSELTSALLQVFLQDCVFVLDEICNTFMSRVLQEIK